MSYDAEMTDVDRLLSEAEPPLDIRRDIAIEFLEMRRFNNGGFLRLGDYDEVAVALERKRRCVQGWWHDHVTGAGENPTARHRERFELDDLVIATVYAHCGRLRPAYNDLYAHTIVHCSEATFRRGWSRLPRMIQEFPRRGWKSVHRHGLYQMWTAPNPWSVFYIDTHTTDLWCWYYGELIRAYITSLIDDHSRFVPATLVTPGPPNARDIAAVLAMGFRHREHEGVRFGGLPSRIIMDNAGENWADLVTHGLTGLDRKPHFVAPYTPEHKGKKERFYLTFEQECLMLLPGWCDKGALTKQGEPLYIGPDDELLQFSQVVDEIGVHHHRYNYERPHQGLGGRTPFEVIAAAAEDKRLRPEPTPAALARAFLDTDQTSYKVHKKGVHVHNRWYTSPALATQTGKQVIVRYLPDEQTQPGPVAVFTADEDEYLGLVVPHDALTTEQKEQMVQARDALTAEVVAHAEEGLGIRHDRARLRATGNMNTSPASVAKKRSKPRVSSGGSDKSLRRVDGFDDFDTFDLNAQTPPTHGDTP